MKVGREPVVRPFMRCKVVVGGSAKEWKIREWWGRAAVNWYGNCKTWWWYGDGGSGGCGLMKSKRSESIIKNTARLCVGDSVSALIFISASDSRLSRNPRTNRYRPVRWTRNTQMRMKRFFIKSQNVSYYYIQWQDFKASFPQRRWPCLVQWWNSLCIRNFYERNGSCSSGSIEHSRVRQAKERHVGYLQTSRCYVSIIRVSPYQLSTRHEFIGLPTGD